MSELQNRLLEWSELGLKSGRGSAHFEELLAARALLFDGAPERLDVLSLTEASALIVAVAALDDGLEARNLIAGALRRAFSEGYLFRQSEYERAVREEVTP